MRGRFGQIPHFQEPLCPMPSAGQGQGLIMEQRRGYPPPRIMRVSDLTAKNSSILSRVFRLQWFGPGLISCCVATLVGCATYHDDLVRGQHYYDLNQYNDALAIWRILEIDWDSLTYAEQSRYAYLRGMTDYRMGFRADARHWLSISKAVEQRHPGGLDAQATAQLSQILTELNTAVYAMGPPPSAVATGVELPNVTANPELPPSGPVPVPQSLAPMTQAAPPPVTNAPATTLPAPAVSNAPSTLLPTPGPVPPPTP